MTIKLFLNERNPAVAGFSAKITVWVGVYLLSTQPTQDYGSTSLVNGALHCCTAG